MIELAHSPDFALGAAIVRPSSREILYGGNAVMVEPKVMQMLVALADPVGRVVPREEIIERCWTGRIVGEDAINRVLGNLRRAAEGQGFQIETVARVGYRLVVATAEPVPKSFKPTVFATILVDISYGRRRFGSDMAACCASPPACDPRTTCRRYEKSRGKRVAASSA